MNKRTNSRCHNVVTKNSVTKNQEKFNNCNSIIAAIQINLKSPIIKRTDNLLSYIQQCSRSLDHTQGLTDKTEVIMS